MTIGKLYTATHYIHRQELELNPSPNTEAGKKEQQVTSPVSTQNPKTKTKQPNKHVNKMTEEREAGRKRRRRRRKEKRGGEKINIYY